jgi:hypothetical protein
MAQIKVLDLDNACSLSELSGEDIILLKEERSCVCSY